MIKQIDIVGQGIELKDDVKKYINKKIGKLDRYMPRHARKSVHAEVKMREGTKKSDKYTCEVILHLPGEQMTAKETTLNMFAAVDIVETKLKNQLRKYKDQAIKSPRISRQKLFEGLRRLARRSSAAE